MEKEIITDVIEAVIWAASQQNGSLSELQAKVSRKVFKTLVNWQLIRVCPKRWKITQKGVRQGNFYRQPTAEEAQRGRMYDRLGL